MRAIKSNELKAVRDNRNQWKISKADLATWHPHSERTPKSTPSTPPDIAFEEQLRAAISRANIAEALLNREQKALVEMKEERDAWKQQAQELMKKGSERKIWWPWKR